MFDQQKKKINETIFLNNITEIFVELKLSNICNQLLGTQIFTLLYVDKVFQNVYAIARG